MSRRLSGVSLLVLLALATFLVGGLQAVGETIVIYAHSQPLTDLDPAYGAFLVTPSGYEAGFVIYDGLVNFDEHMNILPALAERWDFSEDSLTWTFYLRRGVKFHDGTPFNADAVRINFERGMDAGRTTTNRMLWAPWKRVEVIDDYTVKLTSAVPYGTALNALAHGAGLMVSPAAIEKYGDHPEHHPVGTGPYKLENFTVGQELTLVANTDFWGEQPKVDKLIFRHVPEASTRIAALLSGEVDVIDAVPLQEVLRLEKKPDVKLIQKPALRLYSLDILLEREFFKDVRVRYALNHAINKEGIAKGVFLDAAAIADSPLAFDTFGHVSVGPYNYDPDRARSLLAEAGWTDSDGDGILDKNGEPFECSILVPEGKYPYDVTVVEAVGSQLGAIGIRVIINAVEKGSYAGLRNAPLEKTYYDMVFRAFNPSNGSGQYALEDNYLSDADPTASPIGHNCSRYKNDEFDRLLMSAKEALDPDERKELLAECQRIVWDDAPSIWLVIPEVITAVRRDVEGVEVRPAVFTILRNVVVVNK